MPARDTYPFSAVVGQDDYKLALLANAVDPLIGGVLAVGERGTAKSTLARAFAALIPAAESAAADAPDQAPFVELPLGATVDRLTGSLDTAKLLAGEGVELSEGLLAAADSGVLYADEVNLLGDHLVDVLLDAAAFGRVQVERDGLSATSPARFLLVGTMNPEEGRLRPQLLDRFGLSVVVSAPADAGERSEIVRRRISFERDPEAFHERFAATEEALRSIVSAARDARTEAVFPEHLHLQIAELCTALGVEGMRADIVIARTARALAALDQRAEVIERDLETAARLALGHRAHTSALEQEWISPQQVREALLALATGPGETAETEAEERAGSVAPQTAAATRAARPLRAPELEPDPRTHGAGPLGRSAQAEGGERPSVDSRPLEETAELDPIATARAAVTRRLLAGRESRNDEREAVERVGGEGADVMDAAASEIRAEDLRQSVRTGREANLVLCVVDASSSVFSDGRSAELRALLSGLVADARRKRDRVGLIVFRGSEARLVAPPSRNHAAVLSGLDTVEPGGTTPLAEGIRLAHETARRELRRNPALRPIVALVTDGHANVGRSDDPLAEARRAARELRREGVTLVVIGETSSGARRFARTTGAEFHPFDPPAEVRDVA